MLLVDADPSGSALEWSDLAAMAGRAPDRRELQPVIQAYLGKPVDTVVPDSASS